MSTRPILQTLVKEPPEREVRHLLVRLDRGPSAASLSQLIAGVETHIVTGTEYAARQRADALRREWNNEGFRLPREGVPVFESLQETIKLALIMGYTVIYDNKYKNDNMTDPRKRNPLGEVPLAAWSGVVGKNGGDYEYAFDGTTIIAAPNLPPNHGLNMRPKTNAEAFEVIQKTMELKATVGRTITFLLGGGQVS